MVLSRLLSRALLVASVLVILHSSTADETDEGEEHRGEDHHEEEHHEEDRREEEGHGEEHHFEMALAIDVASPYMLTIRVEKALEGDHHEKEGPDDKDHDQRVLAEEQTEYPFAHNRAVVSLIPGACHDGSIRALEASTEVLKEAEDTTFTELLSGKPLKVVSSHGAYAVEMLPNAVSFLSQFHFDLTEPGCFVLISEHRLEPGSLQDSHGYIVAATTVAAEEGDEMDSASWPYGTSVWVSAIGATLVVCLASLVGVLLLICGIQYQGSTLRIYSVEVLCVSFGVLLAITTLRLLPDANALYGPLDWVFGVIMLASISVAFLVKLGFSLILLPRMPKMDFVKTQEASRVVRNGSGAWNVIWGDLFQNLTSGVLIGTAFAKCPSDSTLGWLVTAGALLYEVPQEMADFTVIYNDFQSVHIALATNLLSSLSAVSGVVLVLSVDHLDPKFLGALLAVNVGVVLFICLAEIAPKLSTTAAGYRQIVRVLLVCFGFVLIGVLELYPQGKCKQA